MGTKERWIKEDQYNYFNKYKEILNAIRIVLEEVPDNHTKEGLSIFPKIITVSDTIIAILEGNRDIALLNASIWSTYLVSIGIMEHIFFRGAIGYGDIIFDEEDKIIMGSTIDEVGEWYDKGQIIGIYTAPSAQFHDYDKHKYLSGENIFTKYSVKLKNAYDYECWLTNWPVFLKNEYDKLPTGNNKPTFKSYVESKFSGTNKINDYNKVQYSLKFLESIFPPKS